MKVFLTESRTQFDSADYFKDKAGQKEDGNQNNVNLNFVSDLTESISN